MKRLLALLLLCPLLSCAVSTAAGEDMDWYAYWSEEMGVHLGKENGQLEKDTGVRNYVDFETGMTSAIIAPKNDQNAITWVKEEAGGRSTWFGLDNSNGVFEEGSRLWVWWLNRGQNPKEWKDCYDKFDDEHKHAAADDRLLMFQIGVTAPDGEAYTMLNRDAALYVQIDDDWDEQNLHAAYIAEGVDETKLVSYEEKLSYPEGTDAFAGLTLNHFSPYVIYETGSVIVPDLPQTGDNSRLALWLGMLSMAGAAVLLLRRRAHG